VIDGSPRILIVRLSAIGDCLHALPVLAALRERNPQACIGWAIEEASHGLLEGHPYVDRFHIFPRRAFKRRTGTLMERLGRLNDFRRELREARYDVALDLQGLTKSGLVTWWSGATRRVGFAGDESREFNRFFCTTRVKPSPEAVHVVERNLALLQPLDIAIPHQPKWVLPDYGRELAELEPFLSERGVGKGEGRKPFVLVNPGATWETKRWPPDRFGEVARGLVERHGLAIVVTWADDEEQRAAEIIVEKASRSACLAPPTSLRQLAALTSQARLFVGNDTGPLHLAVALGVPCVSVFGASDPLRNGPYGSAHRIQAAGPDCQPCWKKTCSRKDLACLNLVTPERVLDSCAGLLKRKEG
jgi:lipopolysaccharide heptosyltransferase I